MTKQATTELHQLSRELRRWREQHSAPTPIPDRIWERAAQLARENGVGPISKSLHLDHAKLKRLTGKLAPNGPVATFVEVQSWLGCALPSAASLCCRVEVHGSGGAVMRAELENASAADLATIFRGFAG